VGEAPEELVGEVVREADVAGPGEGAARQHDAVGVGGADALPDPPAPLVLLPGREAVGLHGPGDGGATTEAAAGERDLGGRRARVAGEAGCGGGAARRPRVVSAG